VHWRQFLKSLKKRGLSGVKFVASGEASLLRLVSAIEMEISEDCIASKRYLDTSTPADKNVEMERGNEPADSKKEFTKNVA